MSGRTRNGRTRDGIRAQQDAQQRAAGGLWALVRSKHPAAIRRVVDDASGTELTLMGIFQIELAQYLQLLKDAGKARREGKVRLLDRLQSHATQSRKHLRTIIVAMGPGTAPGQQRPQLPDSLERHLSLVEDAAADVRLCGGDLVD